MRPAVPDGIVLAGGSGTRLGHPKATASLGGRTLVERALDLVADRCGRVVVVGRPEIPLPRLAAEVVHDRPGPDCPLTAIATGLAVVAAPRVLVLACDLPFAAPLVDALLAADAPQGAVGTAGGLVQPLCAVYPRAAARAAAERLIGAGDLRARGLPEALGAFRVDDRWDALANLNTAEDLARAAARLSS